MTIGVPRRLSPTWQSRKETRPGSQDRKAPACSFLMLLTQKARGTQMGPVKQPERGVGHATTCDRGQTGFCPSMGPTRFLLFLAAHPGKVSSVSLALGLGGMCVLAREMRLSELRWLFPLSKCSPPECSWVTSWREVFPKR